MAAILGGPGNETLNGTLVGDLIGGADGNDILRGFFGNDAILGNAGSDLVVGGPGADELYGGWLTGEDEIPDPGFDILSYRDSFFSVRIDLQARTASGGDAEGDTFSRFEGVEGSQDGDTLAGDGNVNRPIGWDGDDFLQGRGGADSLLGGDGDDVLVGGAGGDLHDGGAGSDTVAYIDASAGITVDLLVPTANYAMRQVTFLSRSRGWSGRDSATISGATILPTP